ncbi:HipA domain-containing protein [Marinagarivorans cellulosilyticus]|uniref:Serine/threonine-protein kinase HipA n=1 Tax=Marinagarivorans cellulosilyticus TaxID=2721545 RepID=A0AAN1WK80_9GAMM|nr:HipA domain-containing protein [Marinagarivorans cellulosilyticus]BCD99158.1 serine/threonine-protein kinase HipA [Marinagarivorans cellulosilyticus]
MIPAAEPPALSDAALAVAAPKVWKVNFGKRTVGALSFEAASQCWAFEYAPRWIKTGFSLAPVQLPLASRVYSCASHEQALNAARAQPIVYAALRDIFDLPALLPTGHSSAAWPNAIGLECIEPAAKKVAAEAFDPVLSQAQALMFAASKAQGGAAQISVWVDEQSNFSFSALCPGAGFTPWCLSVSGDAQGGIDGCRTKYCYYLMAQAAGLTCVPTRLLESSGLPSSALLVARHDFTQQAFQYFMPFKYLLGPTIEQARQKSVITEYRHVLTIAAQWHCSRQQLLLLFRRMVFAALTRNGGSPLENLGFLVNEAGKVTLAPAFGFTPKRPPPAKADVLECKDLLKVAAGFKCLQKQASQVIDEVVAVVEQWPTFAKTGGLPHESMQRLQRAHRLF